MQVIRSLSPLYHIVQLAPADSTVQIWPANNNWKATDKLLDQLEHTKTKDSITLLIQVTDTTPFAIARLVRWELPEKIARVRVAKRDWEQLMAQHAVLQAEIPRTPKTEIVINTADPTLNRITTVRQRLPDLHGEGMRIVLKETLFDTTDVDLQFRYLPTRLAPATTAPHATIMATLIGGAGNSAPSGMGIAPRVMMGSSDFSRLLPDETACFSQYGIHTQNHSYGTGIENYYGMEAAAYDDQIYTTDTLLHVFSSGNIGNTAPASGLYNGLTGFANLSGTFKQAKNLLTVGGTDGANAVPALSSRGPAYDGRVKPEIVAYGEDGTSGAAALASGVSLLVQESYRNLQQRMPPASLVKAVLINSADDIGAPGVDFQSGFGALNAWQAVQTIREQRFSQGTVTNGNVYTQSLNIPSGISQAKITLCYTDPPAAVNSARALVNDLDLWLQDAAGNRYEPWVLSTAPLADSLNKSARHGRDSLNNVEQVTISLPAAGTYTIFVKGYRVTTTAQRFHLAWQLTPVQYFDWQYPSAGDALQTGKATPLRWQSSITGSGTISLSLDNGLSWQPVTTTTTIESGSSQWTPPETFGKAILKMETPSQSFLSAPFTLSPLPVMKAGFDCKDSAMLYWNSIPGASGYRVYAKNGPYLSSYIQQRDTIIVLQKQQANASYFAVSPLLPDGTEGLRSRGMDYHLQGLQCYILSFTADVTAGRHVQLGLKLGSTYKLKGITWERREGQQYVALGQAPVTNATVYTQQDERPLQGVIYYRAKLETTDGRFLYTDPVPVQVLTRDNFLLFPNPVTSTLFILSRDLQLRELRILDVQGRLLRRVVLSGILMDVGVAGLPAGHYWAQIYEGGQWVFTGKFIKL